MRGLESLIPQKRRDDQTEQHAKESVFLIEIEKIKPNPYQPRKEFDEKELKRLAESIRQYGILQPLLVTKVEKDVPSGRQVEYELIAGERRLRAAKMAKLPQVPVIVKRSTEAEKLEMSLIENIQRDDLNVIEEAMAYKQLIEEFGLSQNEIAQKVGKSRPVISNSMRILRLPENILAALRRDEINEGHTRPLLMLPKEDLQNKLFWEITNHRLVVRDAERRANEILKAEKVKRTHLQQGGRASYDPELKALAEQLKTNLRLADVRIRTKGRRAHLAIGFSSKRELSDWVKKFLGEDSPRQSA